jgi:predicted DNA-binding ribbon-helix-helix protein
MKSTVVKRSIVLAGHKTSVSLEDAFWEGLKDIAKARRVTLSDLVGGIDTNREHANLSSALRLFVLDHCQKRAASGTVVDNSVRAAEYTNVHDTDDWPNERRL